MKRLTYPTQLLLGVLCGLPVGWLTLVPHVRATECASKDSVELTFESASSALDAPFWQREFTPLADPQLYDRRSLTNNRLLSHDGWWGLKHKGEK